MPQAIHACFTALLEDRALPDQAVIDRAKQAERAAFEAVVERHQGAIYGYLRARLLQAVDAEDMTQEVFLRCYASRARCDSTALIRPWLLGIARNLLREHARQLRRQKETSWTELCLELDELAGAGDDDEAYDAVLRRLPDCLAGLGPSARQAIDLFYTSRLRVTEISDKLRRSEGAVRVLMHRARQALRLCLEGRGGETSNRHPADA